jgi:hypothetical protein
MNRGSGALLGLRASALAGHRSICFEDVGGVAFVLANDATPQKRMVTTLGVCTDIVTSRRFRLVVVDDPNDPRGNHRAGRYAMKR